MKEGRREEKNDKEEYKRGKIELIQFLLENTITIAIVIDIKAEENNENRIRKIKSC